MVFARRNSLKGVSKFSRVRKKGRLMQSDSFGVGYFARGDADPSLFGIVVSTKIAREAFQRNRVRRAISESIRYTLSEIKPGFDVVFLVKPTSLRRSTDELMKETKAALIKIGLVK
jgi:ribonuclease P protein component